MRWERWGMITLREDLSLLRGDGATTVQSIAWGDDERFELDDTGMRLMSKCPDDLHLTP